MKPNKLNQTLPNKPTNEQTTKGKNTKKGKEIKKKKREKQTDKHSIFPGWLKKGGKKRKKKGKISISELCPG